MHEYEQEDTWLTVDETGHVPGMAAELPHGHKVLLDAAGNIMAIAPGENVAAIAADIQPESLPDAPQTPQPDDATFTAPIPETPPVPAVDAPDDAQPEPVGEPTEPLPDVSAQPDGQTSVQGAGDEGTPEQAHAPNEL